MTSGFLDPSAWNVHISLDTTVIASVSWSRSMAHIMTGLKDEPPNAACWFISMTPLESCCICAFVRLKRPLIICFQPEPTLSNTHEGCHRAPIPALQSFHLFSWKQYLHGREARFQRFYKAWSRMDSCHQKEGCRLPLECKDGRLHLPCHWHQIFDPKDSRTIVVLVLRQPQGKLK